MSLAACRAAGPSSRHAYLLLARFRRAVMRRRQPPQAADGVPGGGGGGGSARVRPRREKVSFLTPGRPTPVVFIHVTQRVLDNILDKFGALGFEAGEGCISQELEDLPEGGAVKLVLLGEHTTATQWADDNITHAHEQQLHACLRNVASIENAGRAMAALPRAPFKDPTGQDHVKLHAAVVAGHTLYLGEHKRVLGEGGVVDLECKLTKIRAALTRGCSPDLASALQGVTHVRLFLAGEAVREGLAVQELVDLAAAAGMSVVLPSGQGLAVVGGAPAMQL